MQKHSPEHKKIGLKSVAEITQHKENKTGLPDNLKSGIEAMSGVDMSSIQVKRNSSEPAKVGALAYAQGNQIHLGPGQEKHLPHEAWHVVQQAQGRVKPTTSVNGKAVNDNPGLEKEADAMGAKALQMRQKNVSNLKPASEIDVAQLIFDEPGYKDIVEFSKQWKRFEDVDKLKPKNKFSDEQIRAVHKESRDSFVSFDIRDLYTHKDDYMAFIHRMEKAHEDEQSGTSHSVEKHVAVDDDDLVTRVRTEKKVERATRFKGKTSVDKAIKYWRANGSRILSEYGYHLGKILMEEIANLKRAQANITPPVLKAAISASIAKEVKIDEHELELQKVPNLDRTGQQWNMPCKWKATTIKIFGKRAIEKGEEEVYDVVEPAIIFPPNNVDIVVSVTDDETISVAVPDDVLGTFF